jgi:hypothetical protein
MMNQETSPQRQPTLNRQLLEAPFPPEQIKQREGSSAMCWIISKARRSFSVSTRPLAESEMPDGLPHVRAASRYAFKVLPDLMDWRSPGCDLQLAITPKFSTHLMRM